ncbi:MAG: AI-2E family transporter [Dehalococcoidia bacterium]|nr:AI-2E family transporter [Dehalococcoidia bacterium]
MTPHRWRVSLWLTTLLVALLVMWSARSALLPFVVGGIMAYALSPVVDRLARALPRLEGRRETVRRGIAVAVIYTVFFGGIGTAAVLLAPTAFDQANHFVEELPNFIEGARVQITGWLERTREGMPPEIRTQIERSTSDLSGLVSTAAVEALQRTAAVLTGSLSMLFGFAIVPFWMFYAMRDRPTLERNVLRAVPDSMQEDIRNVARMADHVVSRYIRSQLLLGLIVGTTVGIVLTLMGIQLSLGLGLWAGITEMIPIIGPWLGAIAGLIIVAATDPGMLVWVLLVYFVVQQLENNFLVPRIQGHAVDLHPGVIIVLLAVAGAVWGLFGMVVVVPLTAILREVFWYADRRLKGESATEAFAHSHMGSRQKDLPLDARLDEPLAQSAST